VLLAMGVAVLAPNSVAATSLKFCSEGSPAFLDPAQSNTGTDFDVQDALFERLVAIERGALTRIPGLATSWDISPGNLVYTFHLRAGVKFHTTAWFKPSREFNADDVLFTYQRLIDRNHPFRKAYPTESSYISELGWEKLIAKIEKVDALTVRFTLRQVTAPFLEHLSNTFASVQSAEYAAQLLKAGKARQINTLPVGTGPFVFKSLQKDSNLRLLRNPHYWHGDLPRVDNLVFVVATDRMVRAQKLKAGECDVSALASQNDVAPMRKDPNITVMSVPGNNVGYLTFNTKKPPLDKLEVRQALDMAIDKKRLVDTVFQGAGRVADSPLPSTNWAHDSTLKAVPYNPEQAKALLKKAGVSDITIALWKLPVQRGYNPNGTVMAEMIQADWAKIGVKTTIVTFEWSEYLKRVDAGEHDVAMAGWYSDPDPDGTLALITCGVANKTSQWCVPAYDDLVTKGRQTIDQDKRKALYHTAQGIVMAQLPWSPIAYGDLTVPVRKNVIDFKLSPDGTMRFDGVTVKARSP